MYAPSEVPAQRPSVVPEVAATELANGDPLFKGAVSGDGVGNGVLGGGVVGEEKVRTGVGEEVEDLKKEVPWDALSPGSKDVV